MLHHFNDKTISEEFFFWRKEWSENDDSIEIFIERC